MQGLGTAGELGLRRMCSVVVVVGGLGFEDWRVGELEDWKAGACVESYVYQLICAQPSAPPAWALGSSIAIYARSCDG